MARSLVLAVVLPLVCSAALADPVSIEVRSGCAVPRDDPVDVRLLSEVLTVDLYDVEAHVRADMVLRNEGPQQEALIAFPQVNHGPEPSEEQAHRFTLEDLRFLVDGQEVPTEQLPPAPGRNTLGLEMGFEFESWHVAKVPFAAGQERRLEVTYHHGHGSSAEGVGLGWRWFPYLLKTASLWKGDVDSIDVTVNYREFVKSLPFIAPPGYRHDETARKITWHFENYPGTPEGIELRWWYRPLEVLVNGRPLEPDKGISAYLLPDRRPILNIASGAALLGYGWERASDDYHWALSGNGHRLEMRPPECDATLDGQPFRLARAPRGPYEDGRYQGLWSCTMGAPDLQRALGLKWTYDPSTRRLDLQP